MQIACTWTKDADFSEPSEFFNLKIFCVRVNNVFSEHRNLVNIRSWITRRLNCLQPGLTLSFPKNIDGNFLVLISWIPYEPDYRVKYAETPDCSITVQIKKPIRPTAANMNNIWNTVIWSNFSRAFLHVKTVIRSLVRTESMEKKKIKTHWCFCPLKYGVSTNYRVRLIKVLL